MNKKVMALAVASVLTAPAVLAQTSNVTLYGRANLSVDQYRAEGATNGGQFNLKPRMRVTDSASRIGVRGIEDLGNGLRAVFQIESGANVDSGNNLGQSGVANANSGFLASRDSFVGLDGGFGRLTFGRQSIFWVNGTIIQTGANYVNAEIPWLNGALAGRVNGPAARQSNTILYTSPTWGGFNFSAGYAPNSEAAPNAGTPITAGTGVNNGYTRGRIYGATLRWAGGPFAVQADHWRNEGAVNASFTGGVYAGGGTNFAGIAGSRLVGSKLLGGWSYLPGAQISLIAIKNSNDNSTQFAGASVDQWIYGVSWEHTFGPIQALAQYSLARQVTGCNGVTQTTTCDQTGSRAYLVGARYLMSKRTWLYATANITNNNANAAADYYGGGVTSSGPGIGGPGTSLAGGGGTGTNATSLPFGADPRIYAIGLFHQF